MYSFVFSHLPILVIAIPMLLAPLVALLPKSENGRWLAWFVSFLASGTVFTGSFYLFLKVIYDGPVTYTFGNWPPPIGIQYFATPLSSYVILVLSALNFLMVPAANYLIEAEVRRERVPLFYSCYLLSIAGLFGMVLTNDIFNLYVFLEISSLATYAMVASRDDNSSLKSAFNYLVIGTLAGIFILLGIAFIYGATGTLNMSDVASTLKEPTKATMAGLIFVLTGLMVKAAIFPLGNWLPRVYQHAPSFVAAFLSATGTKVALVLIIKLIYVIYNNVVFDKFYLSTFLLTIGLLGVIYGSLAATMQNDVRRMLGFSSLANLSYIFIGIAIFKDDGLTSSLFHLIAHGLAQGGLFLIIAIIAQQNGGTHLIHFRGMGKKLPLLMACFTILSLSLVGIPLTPGFISKWYLLDSAFAITHLFRRVMVMAALIIGSLLSVIYIGRVIETAYFKKTIDEAKVNYFPSFSVMMITALSIFFGLYPSPVIRFLKNVSHAILAGGYNGG